MKDNLVRFVVIGPDEIPIRATPFRSEQEAQKALQDFVLRFSVQGYYRDANGEAISVEDIPKRCRIEPTLE